MRDWRTCALLGAAGRAPRVDVLDPTDDVLSGCARLGTGESVYSLSCSQDGNRLSVGTKTGRVTIFGRMEATDSHPIPDACRHELPHRYAPVLDTAFVSDPGIIVSNINGGCVLYPLGSSLDRPRALDCHGHTVCALCVVGDNLLAGLTIDGVLVFWNLRDLKMVRTIPLLRPPLYAALVRLQLWREASALIYPSEKGDIVSFNLSTGAAKATPAHIGEFYAVARTSGGMLTIGKDDCFAKKWNMNFELTGPAIPSPAGVIDGGWLDEAAGSLLLIHEKGSAAIYEASVNGWAHVRTLPGSDYRVCKLPAAGHLQRYRDQQALVKARHAAKEAMSSGGTPDELAKRLTILESTGFSHVSLALRAAHSEKAGDLPAALRDLSALARSLPGDAVAGNRTLWRYARLLERACRFTAAAAVYRRLASGARGCEITPALAGLLEKLEKASDPLALCWADPRVPVLCECASALEVAFSGRWVVKELQCQECRSAALHASDFVKVYDGARKEPHLSLPRAVPARLPFVTQHGTSPGEFVLLREESDAPHFELCLKMEQNVCQTLIRPLVIFSVPCSSEGLPATQHNHEVASAYSRLQAMGGTKVRINTILDASINVLRQLITISKHERERQTGGS